ncbi:hypothetical protein [Paraburkholderia adhaesiva]|uniref:hypothetical protein n=1 Tax=Paraburkholderia adhaesiva TaxID=2883244 RepID=UPI001F2090CB|nr:hypothetical protein [Paraburkholderia adhaesiva]
MSVKSLQDLRNLLVHGHVPTVTHPQFTLKNAIDGEHDSVKVAVYKFLSDHIEHSIASVIHGLKGHGYEGKSIVCAINTLVNEGSLASHKYGTAAQALDICVRLIEGKVMPEVEERSRWSKSSVYRHKKTASVRNTLGTLNQREGIETAIWKAMQDHAVRSVETIVEIVRLAGFAPSSVRGEIMLLEQMGWFEIDRSGGEPTCRLRDAIEMPAQARVDAELARQREFDPTQPAEPGSLLAKVQQAQFELDKTAQLTNARDQTANGDGQHGGPRHSAQLGTARERICQILANGQHLSTMEIFSALQAGSFNLSKSRLYELVRTLHGDGLLLRDEDLPEGSNAAYRYWLAHPSPVPDHVEPAPAQQEQAATEPDGPLVISVRLRGVELTLQECGELLQEFSDLWFPGRQQDCGSLIQSHFTIKGVDLSLAELLEVASCLADAAAYLRSMPGQAEADDHEGFPERLPAS